jgi:hypothetical protein
MAKIGVEILQIALASGRAQRGGIIALGMGAVIACVAAAFLFVSMQDEQARSLSSGPPIPSANF